MGRPGGREGGMGKAALFRFWCEGQGQQQQYLKGKKKKKKKRGATDASLYFSRMLRTTVQPTPSLLLFLSYCASLPPSEPFPFPLALPCAPAVKKTITKFGGL